MTRAQTIFVTGLGTMSVLIVGFAVYVVSSTRWADRWYRRRG